MLDWGMLTCALKAQVNEANIEMCALHLILNFLMN